MTQDSAQSLGTTLRLRREESGRSREEISERTKIRANIISSIENDELHAFEPLYMKSFVKEYARALGLKDDEIASLIASAFVSGSTTRSFFGNDPSSATDIHLAPEFTKDSPEKKEKKKKVSVSIGAGSLPLMVKLSYAALALGLLAVGYYFTIIKPKQTTPKPALTDTLKSQNSVMDIKPEGNSAAQNSLPVQLSPEAQAAMQQGDSLVLEARALEQCWVIIVLDGKKSYQLTMEAGMKQLWSAEKIITLSLGNAGGIEFTLNGKPLAPLGRKGYTLRNVRITSKGVVGSNLTSIPLEQKPPPQVAVKQNPKAKANSQKHPKKKEDKPVITPAPLR